jgi:hypothetical protein
LTYHTCRSLMSPIPKPFSQQHSRFVSCNWQPQSAQRRSACSCTPQSCKRARHGHLQYIPHYQRKFDGESCRSLRTCHPRQTMEARPCSMLSSTMQVGRAGHWCGINHRTALLLQVTSEPCPLYCCNK